MKTVYKGLVKWTGNHYFSGEEIEGSEVRQNENGSIEIFHDKEFDGPFGISPDVWVEVAQPTVTKNGALHTFPLQDPEPYPDIPVFFDYIQHLK